jgi:pilus assembly protein Flp/PilA
LSEIVGGLALGRAGMLRFATDESGTTSIEYGLIALLVAVGILSAVTLLGSQVADTFNAIAVAYQKA